MPCVKAFREIFADWSRTCGKKFTRHCNPMTSLEGKDETREKTDTERGSYLDKTDVKTEKRDTEV